MSYDKLKKKQLIQLVKDKDNEMESLQNMFNDLQIKQNTLEEELNNKTEMDDNDITMDNEVILFLEERIKNCIYKDLVKTYKRELKRILNF